MAPTTHNWRDDMKAGEYVDKDGDPVMLDDTEDGPAPIEERKELSVQKRPADEVDGLGEREIEFIASTPEEDRDGDIIEQSGIKLGPFKENPVFLYAHRQGMPPVGKVTKAEIRGGQMIARVKFLGPDDVGEFAADHEHVKFAEMLFRLYKGGFMSAVSIGFMAEPNAVEERDDGGFRFKQIEVMELSAVSVQSNRGATAIQRALKSDEGDSIRKIVKDVASTHEMGLATKSVDEDGKAPDDFPAPPEAVRDACRTGLEWHEQGLSGDGLQSSTVRWAGKMADGDPPSKDKALKMGSWFSRHLNQDGPLRDDDGDPTPRAVAIKLWGGKESGPAYTRRLYRKMERDIPEGLAELNGVPAQTKAEPDELGIGDFVRWDSSGGTAQGQIEEIERDGTIDVPDADVTVNGEPDDPAALIQIYQEEDDGWAPTGTMVAHRFSTLTAIDPLATPDGESRDRSAMYRKESRTLSKANEARAIEIVAQGAKMLMDHDENRAMDVLDQIRRGTHPMEGEDGMDDDKSTDLIARAIDKGVDAETLDRLVKQLNEDVADEIKGILRAKRDATQVMVNLVGGGDDFEEDAQQEFLGLIEKDMRRNETLLRILGLADQVSRPQMAQARSTEADGEKSVDCVNLVYLPDADAETAEKAQKLIDEPAGEAVVVMGGKGGEMPTVEAVGQDDGSVRVRVADEGIAHQTSEKIERHVNDLLHGDTSTPDTPDLPVKEFAAKMVTDFLDLPLAARDREWDSEGAVGRWRDFSDSTEEPTDQYRDNFIWVDSEEPGEFESYKLPYGDVIDGTHHAVPRAIFAIAAALQGARGGVDIPESDMDDARAHVEQYYAKAREEFDDDAIIAPWNTEDSLRVWMAKQADALGIEKAPSVWIAEKVAPPIPDEGDDTDADKGAEPDEAPETDAEPTDTGEPSEGDEKTQDTDATPALRIRRGSGSDESTDEQTTDEHPDEPEATDGPPAIRINR